MRLISRPRHSISQTPRPTHRPRHPSSQPRCTTLHPCAPRPPVGPQQAGQKAGKHADKQATGTQGNGRTHAGHRTKGKRKPAAPRPRRRRGKAAAFRPRWRGSSSLAAAPGSSQVEAAAFRPRCGGQAAALRPRQAAGRQAAATRPRHTPAGAHTPARGRAAQHQVGHQLSSLQPSAESRAPGRTRDAHARVTGTRRLRRHVRRRSPRRLRRLLRRWPRGRHGGTPSNTAAPGAEGEGAQVLGEEWRPAQATIRRQLQKARQASRVLTGRSLVAVPGSGFMMGRGGSDNLTHGRARRAQPPSHARQQPRSRAPRLQPLGRAQQRPRGRAPPHPRR